MNTLRVSRSFLRLAASSSLRPVAAALSSSSAAQARPLRLDGRVAIITGGSSGIGRESAILFAREGAKVVIADVNEAGSAETAQLVADASPLGKAAVRVQRCDVSREADLAAVVKTAEKEFGALHVMFNNAGLMDSRDGDAQETSDPVWDLTFNVNVKGVWYGCRHAIPAMQRAGGGSIINTASFVGKMGAATAQLAYTASKGAVLALSRELAIIHARQGIRVNALCPGPLRTELLMKFLNTEEKRQRRLVHLPMGRFGEAKEMAQAALFLASNESSYITGTDFLVDGGLCAAYVTPQ